MSTVVLKKTVAFMDSARDVLPPYMNDKAALTSLMGHFGGSNYAFKPSAIVTYSVGPFGGTRAAMALRPFLSELGCLPVSKLTCFASAGDLFEDDGTAKDSSHRMLNQFPAMLTQLEWFALACKNRKASSGTP